MNVQLLQIPVHVGDVRLGNIPIPSLLQIGIGVGKVGFSGLVVDSCEGIEDMRESCGGDVLRWGVAGVNGPARMIMC